MLDNHNFEVFNSHRNFYLVEIKTNSFDVLHALDLIIRCDWEMLTWKSHWLLLISNLGYSTFQKEPIRIFIIFTKAMSYYSSSTTTES